MTSPLVLFATVFAIAFALQTAVPGHRILLAMLTTLLPVAALILTVWWRIWDRDALWVIGLAMVVFESAAASIGRAVAAAYVRRSQRR